MQFPRSLHVFYIDVFYFIIIGDCNKCHCYGIVPDYSRCIYWQNERVDWFRFFVIRISYGLQLDKFTSC